MDNQQPSLDLRECKKCGEAKPLIDFPVSHKKGYRRHECAECRKAYHAAWYRGEIKKVEPGSARTCRKCGEAKLLEEFAVVYAKNTRGQNYRRHTCQDCAKLEHSGRMRKARAVNAEKYKQHQRDHRTRNLDKVRRQRRESGRRLKDLVFEAYGGYRCRCCSETEPSMLTLDHINEDGSRHRWILSGGVGREKSVDMYRRLKNHNYPTYMQVLCYNCNISKHRNKGICAHKIKEGSETSRKA